MDMTRNPARTLCVGFEGEALQALRARFDVRCVIAEDASADIDWRQLHELHLQHDAPHMTEELQRCFDTLKLHFLQFNDINSRRYYYVPGREAETYNGFVLSFYAACKLLKQYDIELLLHANIPHEGFDFIFYQVARALGIKTVLCYQSLFSNRFWMTRETQDFGLCDKNPQIFPLESSGYTLPTSWFYMAGSDQDAAYSLKTAALEVLRRPQRLPPALVRYVYARQFRQQVAACTQVAVPGEPYIYFPLHLQPELTTSALGGAYADQMLAIEALSSWLPKGYFIYLKENPKQTEKQRGPLFYKRLAALKNVRLLSRTENSIALIKGSVGVATVTGTAGWEALFHGKPVLVFGLAWYRGFSGVTEFRRDLDFASFSAGLPPPSEGLVEELDHALQSAGKGVIDAAYQGLVSDFSDAANGVQVADSIARYVSAVRLQEEASPSC
jgi:hypothetical protein